MTKHKNETKQITSNEQQRCNKTKQKKQQSQNEQNET
jgi:hypothetical protein